jgi:hypothetical protein
MLGLGLNQGEQLIERDPVEHVRPNAVDDSKGYLGSVLRRIDVHAKRALAKPLSPGEIFPPQARLLSISKTSSRNEMNNLADLK